MLRQAHTLERMRIHATDGDIGHVHDLYFDDSDWRVRYLHVDTRRWFGRHVLLALTMVQSVDWNAGRISVAITREQVRRSPDIDLHKTVPLQHKIPLEEYFVWWPLSTSNALWEGEALAARLRALLIEMHPEQAASPSEQPQGDTHLWSAHALRHYSVESDDNGDLGRVDDVLIDPEAWTIRYISVEKGSPLHVNRALLAVEAVQWIGWDTRRLRVIPHAEANAAVNATHDRGR